MLPVCSPSLNYNPSSQSSPSSRCSHNLLLSTHTSSRLNKKRCRFAPSRCFAHFSFSLPILTGRVYATAAGMAPTAARTPGSTTTGHVTATTTRGVDATTAGSSGSTNGPGTNCSTHWIWVSVVRLCTEPSPSSSSIAQTIRLHPRYPLCQCRQHRVELMEQATDLFSPCRARLPAPMRPHTHRHLHPHRPPPRRLERILQALVFQARVPPVLTRSTRTSRPCSPIATMDKIPLETLVCFGTDTRRLAGPLRRRYLVVASTTPLRRRTSNSLSRVTIMSSPSFLYNGVRFLYRSWMGCDLLGFILFVFPP